MAYTSDCGPTFTAWVRIPFMYVGDTYNVPNSPYSITLLSMDCESVVFPPDFSNTIRVFKNGVAIGDHTCYPFLTDPASCPTSFDNNNICISNVWMDCLTPNNCQYDIWYTENLITTHILDLVISPYSWYTPQGAADYLINNLAGINGIIMNWLTPLTGWTFLYTEIITDGPNVIIRVHLNENPAAATALFSASDMQTLVAQVVALGDLLILIAAAGVIFIAIGVVVVVTLITVLTGNKDVAKQFTPEEVVKLVISDPDSIVARQLANCDTNFAGNAIGLKLCYDSVIKGAQDGLADKLKLPPPQTNTPAETQKCLDQYLIDSNWINYQTCLKAVKDKAGGELLDAVTCPAGQYYDATQGKCVTTEECWIAGFTPGSCLLTANTGKTVAIIGGVALGGYLLFKLIKK